MNKLVEFGRKAWFLVRVMSGYEERRIRAYRLQLQKRIEQARARKAEMNKLHDQAILSEVRRLVEQMQTLNNQLEETEAAIEEYFKPVDKSAQIIMNMQLEKEEKQAKEMMKIMQEQAMMQQAMAQKRVEIDNADAAHLSLKQETLSPKQEQSK